ESPHDYLPPGAASAPCSGIRWAPIGGTNRKVAASNFGVTFHCIIATYCGCDGSLVVVMTSLRGSGVLPRSIQTCQSTPSWRTATWSHTALPQRLGPMTAASLIAAVEALSVPQ